MTDVPPTPDPDDVLRRALQAEADGVEASEALLDRTMAAASRPPVRAGHRLLVAAAVAAIAIGAGVALAIDDDDQQVDSSNDPASTTTTPPGEAASVLAALFPCQDGDPVRLSLLVDVDEVAAVRGALEGDDRTLDVVEASEAEVDAAMSRHPGDGAHLVAISATYAHAEDELGVRSTVADLPGIDALGTADCAGSPPVVSGPPADGARPTTVALVREDGWLVTIDLATGEERELHFVGDPKASSEVDEGGPSFIDAVDLSPDGAWVYFSTCCEPASGNTHRIPVTGGEPDLFAVGSYPRVSPDGRFLATGAADHLIVTPIGEGQAVSLQLDCCLSRLAWSPDGTQLAVIQSTGADGDHPRMLLFDWDGTSLTPADPGKPDNPGAFVAWTPEGIVTTISGGGSADSSRSLAQDSSYRWLIWVDAEGVVREQAGLSSGELPAIAGLPEALSADW